MAINSRDCRLFTGDMTAYGIAWYPNGECAGRSLRRKTPANKNERSPLQNLVIEIRRNA